MPSISQPDDPQEVAADRLADRVMAASPGSSPVGRRAAVVTARREAAGSLPAAVARALENGGQPLDAGVRTMMEARFDADFGGVRVLRGSTAADSASGAGANAYTVGHRIVFGAGQYAPGTTAGQRLIAHELSHVVQNARSGGGGSPTLQRDDSGKDDAAVQGYIDEAMRRNNGNVGNASLSLMAMRNESASCGDDNLAAAEHYMFARYLVSELHVPTAFVTYLVVEYSLLKIAFLEEYHFLNALMGECQASAPSLFQVKWGLEGVVAGKKAKPWWSVW